MRPTVPSTPEPSFRVLCVDDNRDVADTTAALLGVVGFEARACYDGPAALRMFESFRPGLCLIDLNMPGMDGDELAVRLHEQANGQPLVLVAMPATLGLSRDCVPTRMSSPQEENSQITR